MLTFISVCIWVSMLGCFTWMQVPTETRRMETKPGYFGRAGSTPTCRVWLQTIILKFWTLPNVWSSALLPLASSEHPSTSHPSGSLSHPVCWAPTTSCLWTPSSSLTCYSRHSVGHSCYRALACIRGLWPRGQSSVVALKTLACLS